jgi:hypothetical protein
MPNGTTAKMYIRMASFVADLEEAWDLLAMLRNGTHPDLATLVPKGRLTDFSGTYARRTEGMHKQVGGLAFHFVVAASGGLAANPAVSAGNAAALR